MNDDNDMLLQQFFSDAASRHIDDNGFTEQVMRRLPLRINWFNRLWTVSCIVAAVVLFTLLHGWELLTVQLEVLFRTLPTASLGKWLMMLVTVIGGLLIAGASEVISSERVRR